LREVLNYCKRDVKIAVLCNKCDTRENIRIVDKNYFEEEELEYYIMSAKTGEGVNEAFLTIIEKIIKELPKVEERRMMSLELR
jgi:GTPase SAR1 family protein